MLIDSEQSQLASAYPVAPGSEHVASPQVEATRVPFSKLRAATKVARTWHSRRGRRQATFEVTSPRAFRRAYVQVFFSNRAAEIVDEPEGGVSLYLHGAKVVTVDGRGAVAFVAERVRRISLAPSAIGDLAAWMANEDYQRICAVYEELAGERLHTASPAFDKQRCRTYRPVVINCMKKLFACMDPEAVRLARRLGVTSSVLLMKLASTDALVASRWREAFTAYPGLLVLACYTGDWNWPLFRVIEEGRPLVPFLARQFECPEAAVRRYRGLLRQRIAPDAMSRDRFLEKLGELGELPQHLRPQSRADHVAALRLVLANRSGRAGVRNLAAGIKCPLGKDRRIDALEGIGDVYRCASSCGVALPEAMSLGRLADLNEAWHRAHREATLESAKASAALNAQMCWPGVLPGDVSLGGLVAVELLSAGALLEEGRRLGHCVGGYAPWALAGQCRLISLRDMEGRSVSTIELFVHKQRLLVRQHHGAGNSKPSPTAAAAEVQLLRILGARGSAANLSWPELPIPTSADVLGLRMREFWESRAAKRPALAAV